MLKGLVHMIESFAFDTSKHVFILERSTKKF